ncbi:MAG TPA: arylsulfatase, partial [Fuerstia sp.]|nr:arylsulfatase [Fuerstiella sp.]
MRWISLALLVFCSVATAPAADKPDILLIMADDIGIEGLGCYGGTSYRTPNLDRMATEGLRFSTAYSQPLCTPTRVQIMTGLYNNRNWKYFGILDPSATTFGHQMKAAGYATGIFGKWQLQSYDPPDLPNAADRRGTGMHPKDAGFDQYALFHSLHTEDKGSRFANPTMLEGAAGSDGELRTYDGRYGEDVWVEQIVDFFDEHRQEPTFVYYPMALPHRPFEPTPDTPAWNPKEVPDEDVKYITDMVEYMDTAVGNLLAGLQAKGLRENTLVLFYADNGFHRKVFSKLNDGRTIQGGKGEPLQTGIHVPLIAHWPGHIQPEVCDDLVDASDFLPTLLDIGGSTLSVNDVTDGVSFAPQLFGKAGRPRDTAFFWYDPRPGWDKERFHRSVFAVNRHYKRFRDGRLFRLTDSPLKEIAVDPLHMTADD